MRTRSRIAAATAAGVVATGLVVAPAAWSAVDRMGGAPVSAEDRPGPGWGRGHMRGPGSMMGGSMTGGSMMGGPMTGGPMTGWSGAGHCAGGLGGAAKGSLSTDQRAMLADRAEREKLSHDVYVAFAESTGDARFDHVARSETMHLAAVRALLERYGIDDPTEGLQAGDFADDEVTTAYDDYLERGSSSLDDALTVSREIERDDISALRRAIRDVDAPDVDQALGHLLRSSRMHLWTWR